MIREMNKVTCLLHKSCMNRLSSEWPVGGSIGNTFILRLCLPVITYCPCRYLFSLQWSSPLTPKMLLLLWVCSPRSTI